MAINVQRRKDEWDYYANGLLGSSYMLIPKALKWFTCGIEYHHIHHLNVAVPSYKIQVPMSIADYTIAVKGGEHATQGLSCCLQDCHEGAEELWKAVPTFGLDAVPPTLKYGVWDERAQDFLSTPELKPREA